MSKVKPDIVISLLIIGVAAFFYSLTFQFPAGNPQDMGPSFVPRIHTTIIMFLGVLLLIKAIRSNEPQRKKGFKLVLLAIGWLFLYILFVPILGFYVMTIIYMVVFMWFVNIRKWLPLVAVPLVTTGLIYLFFKQLLKVPIPTGTLF